LHSAFCNAYRFEAALQKMVVSLLSAREYRTKVMPLQSLDPN